MNNPFSFTNNPNQTELIFICSFSLIFIKLIFEYTVAVKSLGAKLFVKEDIKSYFYGYKETVKDPMLTVQHAKNWQDATRHV